MEQVWALSLGLAEKLLLLALADRADDNGECFMLVSTLAKKCGMHRATVLRSMCELEKAGHLTRLHRPGRSTVFRIHPSQSATSRAERPVAESDPSQSATSRAELTNPSQAATDPSHKATDPSRCATHIRFLSVSDPSTQAGEHAHAREDSRGTLDAGTALTELSPEVAAVFADYRDAWKRDVEGVNVDELQRFFDFAAREVNPPSKRKDFSPSARLSLAKRLAGMGDLAYQAQVVEQSISSDHATLYALKDQPSKGAKDSARRRQDEQREMLGLKTRAITAGFRQPHKGEDVADYRFRVERAEREKADADYRAGISKRGPRSAADLPAGPR